MHYYQFNIADYRKDTSHLSMLEHGIYRTLLDWYYLDEKPIPKETQLVSRRLRLVSESDSQALQNVLSDFFQAREDGFHHLRCDMEIAEYALLVEKNRENGKKGGRPKASKHAGENPVGYQSDDLGNPDQSQTNPNQEPITNNQEDISSGSTSIPTISADPDQPKLKLVSKTIPDCPHADILALWLEKLPAAIQPADWNEKRQQALRSRWREKGNRQKLEWWARFFEYIAQSDFLMGRTNTPGRKAFALSLDWLCKSENFLKVIEGRFHEQEAVAV
jgi:uncharacterized protein YdaU (DUF1376 family)